MPLLAFTLEQLYIDYGGGGALKLADYEAFGGIRGAIEGAVRRALAAADDDARIPREREARLALLRRGLIPWLAGIDPETGSPRRRVARLADIPQEAAPLVRLLVEQRLLATDRVAIRDGDQERSEITIEPAHEALLRQWGLLRGWLEEDFGALTTLEAVKRATRDWAANECRADWLNHAGSRLDEAEKVAARSDLAGDLSQEAREYLRQCREREQAAQRERLERLEREREEQERRVRDAETLAIANRRTARRTGIGLVAALALAIVAGWQWWMAQTQTELAQTQTKLAQTQTRLAEQAAEQANKEAERADLKTKEASERLQQALLRQAQFLTSVAGLQADRSDFSAAALVAIEALSIWPPAEPAVYRGVSNLRELAVLRGHWESVASAAFGPDGARVATASNDGTVRLWSTASGKEIMVLRGHQGGVGSVAFSSDGTRIVTASNDRTARLWDALTGRELVVFRGHTEMLRLCRNQCGWQTNCDRVGRREFDRRQDRTGVGCRDGARACGASRT